MEKFGWQRRITSDSTGQNDWGNWRQAIPQRAHGRTAGPHFSREIREISPFVLRVAEDTGAVSSPAEESAEGRRQRVEAVLLLSRTPLPMRKLAQLAGLADATEARTLVRQINQLYTERGRAFRVDEVAGGVQILTRPQLAPWLRRLGHIPKTVQLTSPAMETLAIVAYRQPVLRAEIEAIRGVACGELLKQLMEKDLVRISGRSEELGRPYLYSTTKSFLQIFGLRGADALPALDDATVENYEPAEELAVPPPVSPKPDQQPETAIPEEDLDVSTAVANLVTDNPECDNDAYVDLSDSLLVATPYAVDEDEDEDFGDEDEDDDYEDDDDDWDDEEEDDELEDEDVEEDDEVDADWEEVEDEEWEEEEEGDEEESEEDEEEELDDDDWDDEDDEDDAEEEDDEEWD